MPGAPALRHSISTKAAPSGGGLSWLHRGGYFVEVGNRSFDSPVKHLDAEVLIGSVQGIAIEAIPHHHDRDFHHIDDVGHDRYFPCRG